MLTGTGMLVSPSKDESHYSVFIPILEKTPISLAQNKCIIRIECFPNMEILNFPRNADKNTKTCTVPAVFPSEFLCWIMALDLMRQPSVSTKVLVCPQVCPLLYTDLFVRGSERTGRGELAGAVPHISAHYVSRSPTRGSRGWAVQQQHLCCGQNIILRRRRHCCCHGAFPPWQAGPSSLPGSGRPPPDLTKGLDSIDEPAATA